MLEWPSGSFVLKFQPTIKQFEAIPEVVREMHAANDLWTECAISSLTAVEVERLVITTLSQRFEPATITLAGNTVHFDRMFLREHMPKLEAFFHYRNFDVSTLKQLHEFLGGDFHSNDVDRAVNIYSVETKVSNHRGMSDVQDAINLYRGLTSRFRF